MKITVLVPVLSMSTGTSDKQSELTRVMDLKEIEEEFNNGKLWTSNIV